MKSLHQSIIDDLRARGDLKIISEEVDPHLQMPDLHLIEFEKKGSALLFQKVKGTKYACSSNLFGDINRSKAYFGKALARMQTLVQLKLDPLSFLKSPWKLVSLIPSFWHALPKKVSFNSSAWEKVKISDLPLIHHWPQDGGAFITLPQVYTEDPEKPGVMNANLGMYRIQLTGNDYIQDQEIGLHYQLHRGIGVHQTKWNALGKPMKVSIFVGGHPAHTFAAVMPLPEGISELTMAGILAQRRFRYSIKDDYVISEDADFVITGEVYPGETKPEGPFGDHLGYYSLKHPFPVLKVHQVWAKKEGIWPFTVVGRPPQEDTQFGALVHLVAGKALPNEIPGLCEVNAVDEAGVHPLLLAIGKERYTPYQEINRPQELLTIGNHILGKGQLSLAKYLWIANQQDNPHLSTHQMEAFFIHMLERVSWARDVHFYTQTTIDTLDYSGDELNGGSKVLIAAVGGVRRALSVDCSLYRTMIPSACVVMKGVLAVPFEEFTNYQQEQIKVEAFLASLKGIHEQGFSDAFPLLVLCDDASFVAQHISNFLWVAFTRSDPAKDIYGIASFTKHKHWGCNGALVIDARLKPHLAPVLTR